MNIKNYVTGVIVSLSAVLVFTSIGPSIASASNSNDLTSQSKLILSSDDYSTIDLDPEKDKELIEIIEDIEVNIIKDDEYERIVETVENGVTSIGIFNKTTNTLTTQIKGNEDSKTVIDLNELEAEAEEQAKEASLEKDVVRAAANTLTENTYSNMEYTITYSSPEKWQLRRPVPNSLTNTYYKNVTKTSSNSTTLSNYKKQVDALNDYEFKFIGAAGVTGTAYNYGIAVERSAKNAKYYYFQL